MRRGERSFLVIVAGLLLAVGAWLAMRSMTGTSAGAAGAGDSAGCGSSSPGAAAGGAGGGSMSPSADGPPPPERTVRDRAVRDAVRQRIAAGWSADTPMHAPPASTTAGPLPKHVGTLDRRYIQERIRADFVPMAEECYRELLSRRPGEQVRVVMQFRIVADPRYGGVVDEAHAVDPADGGTRIDDELGRCMSESMLAMAFRPPDGEGGVVTVHYPVVMSPSDGSP